MFALWALVIGVSGWSYSEVLDIKNEIQFRNILKIVTSLQGEQLQKEG
jgi:hypothetical protein